MAKPSKESIVEQLTLDFGYKEEELPTEYKDLCETLKSAKAIGEAEEVKENPKLDETQTLSLGDIGWTEYVLSLFADDEKINNSPTVDGLRRVATKLIGLYGIESHVVQTPDPINNGRATVTVNVHTNAGVYSGSADVFTKNTEFEYAVHPVATAETRAEGRALRKALRLKKVLAAEEIVDKDLISMQPEDTAPVEKGMLTAIKSMCMSRGLNLDLQKIVAWKNFNGVEAPEDLNKAQALEIATNINNWNKDPNSIPQEIKKV